MFEKTEAKRLAIWGICLVGLIVLLAPPVQAEEGVTDTVIHIGQTGPLSGPAALWGGTVKGAALRFAMENEAGSIFGRKIQHHMYDDAYNPARTKIGVKQLQESIGMFAWIGGVGTSNGMAVKDYLMSRDIPWLGPLSGSSAWFDPPQKYLFSVYPPYIFEAKVLCDYAVKQQGKKRVAIVYQDDGYGLNGLKGAQAAVKQHGLSLAATIPVGRNDTDMARVAAQLRNADADAVLLWLSPFTVLRLLKVAEQMNYTPQWMASSTLSMLSTFYRLSQGLVKGVITANYLTEDKALISKYKQAQERLDPEASFDTSYLLGIGLADVLIEAMKRCGPDLTRDGLVKGLEALDGYPTLTRKCVFKPYDPNNPMCRLGTRQLFLQQCETGGKSKMVTGWIDVEY